MWRSGKGCKQQSNQHCLEEFGHQRASSLYHHHRIVRPIGRSAIPPLPNSMHVSLGIMPCPKLTLFVPRHPLSVPPSTMPLPITQQHLPYITDTDLLHHARLLVKSWTSDCNHYNLFLTQDSRVSVLNHKLGRPVVAQPGTIVHQFIRGTTLDVNRCLLHQGRPLLCSDDFPAALVDLAVILSQAVMQHEAKRRYSGLPIQLLDEWYTRVGELCIYLTLDIVPEGAEEHVLKSHSIAPSAPQSRREKKPIHFLASTPAVSTAYTASSKSSISIPHLDRSTSTSSRASDAILHLPGDSTLDGATVKAVTMMLSPIEKAFSLCRYQLSAKPKLICSQRQRNSHLRFLQKTVTMLRRSCCLRRLHQSLRSPIPLPLPPILFLLTPLPMNQHSRSCTYRV